MNLPAPHPTEHYFELRTRGNLRFDPWASMYLTFSVQHFCPKKTSTALILQCRHMSFKKLIMEPLAWAPNHPPTVKAVNASQGTLYIPAGETLAKVIFTAPGVTSFSPSLTSTIDSLSVPRMPVSLSRIPQDKNKYENPFR